MQAEIVEAWVEATLKAAAVGLSKAGVRAKAAGCAGSLSGSFRIFHNLYFHHYTILVAEEGASFLSRMLEGPDYTWGCKH